MLGGPNQAHHRNIVQNTKVAVDPTEAVQDHKFEDVGRKNKFTRINQSYDI